MDEIQQSKTVDGITAKNIDDKLIYDARECDAFVRDARESLAVLTTQPVYMPTPVSDGKGTRLASFLYYPFTKGREEMFRNRHVRERMQLLRRFLSNDEQLQLREMMDDPTKPHALRKRLMFLHRELISLYRQILLAYSETAMND